MACAEEQILNDEQPDMDGCPGGENLDDEGEAMVEEALSGILKQHTFVSFLQRRACFEFHVKFFDF